MMSEKLVIRELDACEFIPELKDLLEEIRSQQFDMTKNASILAEKLSELSALEEEVAGLIAELDAPQVIH